MGLERKRKKIGEGKEIMYVVNCFLLFRGSMHDNSRILLLLVDLSKVLWDPSRHLGSLTAANWVSFDFNVSYSSC